MGGLGAVGGWRVEDTSSGGGWTYRGWRIPPRVDVPWVEDPRTAVEGDNGLQRHTRGEGGPILEPG